MFRIILLTGALVACGTDGKPGKAGSGCTVTQAEEGAYVYCDDGTSAFVADGERGEPGVDGADGLRGERGVGERGEVGGIGPEGRAGTSCTVEQLDEYTARISCEDGSEAVIGGPVYVDNSCKGKCK